MVSIKHTAVFSERGEIIKKAIDRGFTQNVVAWVVLVFSYFFSSARYKNRSRVSKLLHHRMQIIKIQEKVRYVFSLGQIFKKNKNSMETFRAHCVFDL